MSLRTNERVCLLAIMVIVAAEFVWDLICPNGLADWVWYFFPIYLSIFVGGRLFSYLLTGLISLLILFAFYHSPPGIDPELAMMGRLTGLSALWLMAVIIAHYKKTETNRRRIERALRTISECNQVLVRATSEPALLQDLCRLIVEKGGYRMCWVVFAENDEQKSVRCAASAGFETGYLAKAHISWSDADEHGRGPIGNAIRTGKIAVSNNIQTDPAMVPWRKEAVQRGYASVIVLPLAAREQAFGVLAIYAPQTGAYQPAEVALLQELANDLAFGIQSLRTLAECKDAERDLREKNARIQHLNNILLSIQEIDDLLSRETNVQKLLATVCESLVKTRGYVAIWVGQPESESKKIKLLAQAGDSGKLLQHASITWDDSPLGQGPTGTAARERRTVVFNDINQDPRFAPWRDATTAGNSAAIAAIPMIHAGQLCGVLTIKADRSNAFDADELVLLTGLAKNLARARQNLEQQAARRQAEENHARLATAVEQLEETIVITDIEGRIVYVNPVFERTTGYTRAEALGQNPRLLKSGKQDARFYRQMWETIGQGKIWKGHFINQHKNGSLFEEDATISPLRDKQGVIVNYVAAKRDVTHELLLESQFRQAQKMEAMGTLAGGIAHDFNNILTVIFGYSYLLQHATKNTPEIHEHVEELLRAASRAKDLVQQILTFSRQHEQKRQIIRLDSVIKEATKFLRASLPSNIEIELHLAADAPAALADPTQIYQVTINLATNALHAMEGQQGRLIVSLDAFTPDEKFIQTHPKFRPIAYARLTIADNGYGMNNETLERIFEPFFTTKPVGKGTGLGLAVVHGIMQSHDGVITVESQPGRGTTFGLYFPAQMGEGAAASQGMSNVPPGQGQKILVVDDEVSITNVLQKLLQLLHYQVTACNQPGAAVDLIKSKAGDYDLVITDLTMPGMNGLELARQIHGLRPRLPVLLVSGFTSTLTQENLNEAGICQLLPKPVAIADLAEALQQHLPR